MEQSQLPSDLSLVSERHVTYFGTLSSLWDIGVYNACIVYVYIYIYI